MAEQSIASRLQRLEDIDAIRDVKARYCEAVDQRDGAAWVELFTEDAVWDGGSFGRYEGLSEIRGYFDVILKNLALTLHYVTNSRIRIEGDEAHATWYLFEPCTMTDGSQAIWGAGTYDEEYIRQSPGWKISRLVLTSLFWTPFDEGWVRRPIWNQ